MGVDVLLGLQWGDEGKGKIVDVLCPRYDLIARFQGGPNAGHTLEFNGEKHVLNTIPSGIFGKKTLNLIGNGVVVDPAVLKKEIDGLLAAGVDVVKTGLLLISKKAHVIIPTHQLLDAVSEQAMGAGKIGSTLKGIGPVYQDKTGRSGLRIGDLISSNFLGKYKELKAKHERILAQHDFTYQLEEKEHRFFEGVELIKKLKLVDGEYFIHACVREGKKILAEGAQGSMLDIDFGSYPYVTSSSTVTAGACTGLGLAPNNIGKVIGIFKAYCTRVGGGPFPTELLDETGEKLRKLGREFGATTGRPRRCGWLDLPALKYAIMLSGVTSLVMTKADVLGDFDVVRICTGYHYGGGAHDTLPFDLCAEQITPIYQDFKGWPTLQDEATSEELPETLINYIAFLEAQLQVSIDYLSTGPDRLQTLLLHEPANS